MMQRQAQLDRARASGKDGAMLVYKILRANEYAAFRAEGRSDGAPVDLADGYIHLSTAAQAAGTLAKHFAGESGLHLLVLDSDALDPLRWEPSRGGALFPHLYRALRAEDVIWSREIAAGETLEDLA